MFDRTATGGHPFDARGAPACLTGGRKPFGHPPADCTSTSPARPAQRVYASCPHRLPRRRRIRAGSALSSRGRRSRGVVPGAELRIVSPPHQSSWSAVRSLLDPSAGQIRASHRQSGARLALDGLEGWVREQPEGNRNAGLFWAACRAAEMGVNNPEPLIAASVAAGLDRREAARTVASAYRRAGPSAARSPGDAGRSRLL